MTTPPWPPHKIGRRGPTEHGHTCDIRFIATLTSFTEFLTPGLRAGFQSWPPGRTSLRLGTSAFRFLGPPPRSTRYRLKMVLCASESPVAHRLLCDPPGPGSWGCCCCWGGFRPQPRIGDRFRGGLRNSNAPRFRRHHFTIFFR